MRLGNFSSRIMKALSSVLFNTKGHVSPTEMPAALNTVYSTGKGGGKVTRKASGAAALKRAAAKRKCQRARSKK